MSKHISHEMQKIGLLVYLHSASDSYAFVKKLCFYKAVKTAVIANGTLFV